MSEIFLNDVYKEVGSHINLNFLNKSVLLSLWTDGERIKMIKFFLYNIHTQECLRATICAEKKENVELNLKSARKSFNIKM